MKVLILSAGQGRRLLPYTAESPKCTIPVFGRSIIEWQIDALFSMGIDRITIVVGYGADAVESLLTKYYNMNRIKLIYNPDFDKSNNLVSCWAAREEMNEDFILLNGDTLFEVSVVQRLLEESVRPITVTIDKKNTYDADDMKVALNGNRLVNIGKDLMPDKTDAESIGMILFQGEGPVLFREALKKALRDPAARKKFYLSVIDKIGGLMPVHTCSIAGLKWCEIDYPVDLKKAEEIFKSSIIKREKEAVSFTA